MKLVKYSPARQLGFPRNFFSSFSDPLWGALDHWEEDREPSICNENRQPAIDVAENEKEYEIQAEFPGVKKEDLHVDVADNVLTLSGERKDEQKEKKNGYHRTERFYGSLKRSFALPEGVDAEKIDAKFENGLLSITIPKGESDKPKKISIH